MPLFTTSQPTISVRSVSKFPANVTASYGLEVTKSNGTYSFKGAEVDTVAAFSARDFGEDIDVVRINGYYAGTYDPFFVRRTETEPTHGWKFQDSSGDWFEGVPVNGVVSVSWTGAKGDGIADDAPPIQIALDYVNINARSLWDYNSPSEISGTVKAVYVPTASAEYLTQSTLNIYTGTELFGVRAGSHIRLDSASADVDVIRLMPVDPPGGSKDDISSVTIRDLSIAGDDSSRGISMDEATWVGEAMHVLTCNFYNINFYVGYPIYFEQGYCQFMIVHDILQVGGEQCIFANCSVCTIYNWDREGGNPLTTVPFFHFGPRPTGPQSAGVYGGADILLYNILIEGGSRPDKTNFYFDTCTNFVLELVHAETRDESGGAGNGCLYNIHCLDSTGVIRSINSSYAHDPIFRFEGDCTITFDDGYSAAYRSDIDNTSRVMMPGNIHACDGTPEGSRRGNIGDLAVRLDGGASTTLYVKESGSSTTGWVAK